MDADTETVLRLGEGVVTVTVFTFITVERLAQLPTGKSA